MDIDPHMIWFITTAVATLAILTLGTLFMAELLPRRGGCRQDAASRNDMDPRSTAKRNRDRARTPAPPSADQAASWSSPPCSLQA